MKNSKIYLAGLFAIAIGSSAISQEMLRPTSKTIYLNIQQDNGTNGSAVTYNKTDDVYYTCIAGNVNYPLETFSGTGSPVHKTKTGIDMRGLWWNSKTNQLEGNSYGGDIVNLKTDQNNFPGMGDETVFSGLNTSNPNACGVIDNKGKEVFYFSEGKVQGYLRKTGEYSKTNVRLKIPSSLDEINSTNMIYTGQKKMEFGILNYVKKEVYLFNKKTGEHTATIKLSDDAITHNAFRFSYANGFIFLYDVEVRKWTGYKTFE